MKRLYTLFALLAIVALALAACGPTVTEEATEEAPAETDTPAPAEPEEAAVKICQVTDVGGIDDKSFNATAWKGVEDAIADFGVEGKYLESQQQTDYEANINAFIEDDCDLIVTVGFLLGDATAAAAEAYPDQKFAIIDVDFFDFDNGVDVVYDNVKELNFATDQAGFLAGYVAASATQTGKVGTFGGIQFPSVTIFMDGFYYGVEYYNEVNGTSVEVLGWDPATQTGSFTGNFESLDDGRALGESLMDEGADIIMPVAGPVGLGTAAAVQERGNAYIIGVDTDFYVSAPEYSDIVLTSVLKNMDVAVYDVSEAVVNGTFEGGLYVGTLENGGVGIAPFHDLDDMVPQEVKDALPGITDGIISGEIAIGGDMMMEEESMADDTLGTAENPIIWVLVPSQDTETVLTGAEEIAQAIEDQTGLIVEPLVTTDFTGAVEAMCSGEAHIGALNTFNYVLAHERGCADVALASERFGSTFYSGQVITQADSGIESIADLAGTTFCRPDPTSTSGWVIPSISMQAEGLNPETDLAEIVDAGGHDGVVLSVYDGTCDAGSTFVDARTNVEEDYPDVMDVVVVIAESAPIPNDTISFAPTISQETGDAIVGVFQNLTTTDEGLEVLNSVYSWSGVQVVEDSFYDGFRQQLEAAGISIEDLTK